MRVASKFQITDCIVIVWNLCTLLRNSSNIVGTIIHKFCPEKCLIFYNRLNVLLFQFASDFSITYFMSDVYVNNLFSPNILWSLNITSNIFSVLCSYLFSHVKHDI